MWHLAKYNIGLSTALGGTGMCIATEIVRKYGWGCECLTEDMEFSHEGPPRRRAHLLGS